MAEHVRKINHIISVMEQDIEENSEHYSEWSRDYFQTHQEYYREVLNYIRDEFEKGELILELGSLPCHLTYLLDRLGYGVVGTDIQPERLSNFISNFDSNIIKCNIERQRLPFEDGSFKYVLFTEVFEHLRINPIRTLREINRVMDKNGKLILSTPNQYSIYSIWSYIRGHGAISDGYHEFGKLECLGHMGHIREYTPGEIKRFLENTGFEISRHEFSNIGKKPGSENLIYRPLALILNYIFPKTRSIQFVIGKKYYTTGENYSND